MVKTVFLTGALLLLMIAGYQNCGASRFSKTSASTQDDVTITDVTSAELTVEAVATPNTPSIAITTCEGCSSPTAVTIKDRLVEIVGTCDSSAGDVDVIGNVLNLTKNSTLCEANQYKHCSLVQNHYQANPIEVKQADKSVPLELLLNAPPIVNLTMDSIVINGNKASVQGICLSGSVLNFTIYNQKQNSSPVICDSEGKYSFDDVKLVPSLKDTGQRVLYVEQIASNAPTRTIYYDVDANTLTPSCSQDNFVSTAGVCTESSGTVEGSCKAGLPVQIIVNGQLQNVGFCSSTGSFAVDDILLNENESNIVKIEQTTPFAKKCSSDANFDL